MLIAISSSGPALESEIDPRFGRCQFFLLYDTETSEVKAIENPATGAMGGAGPQAAQCVADNKAEAVLTGNVGPSAITTLKAMGVKVFIGIEGTAGEAVEQFKQNALQEADQATVAPHSGMKPGRV